MIYYYSYLAGLARMVIQNCFTPETGCTDVGLHAGSYGYPGYLYEEFSLFDGAEGRYGFSVSVHLRFYRAGPIFLPGFFVFSR